MNYPTKIAALILLLMIPCLPVPVRAQQAGIDTNRMNRDINIMENILEEVFKVKSHHGGFALAGNYFFGSDRDIRGTYLPGYGVIFLIPDLRSDVAMLDYDDDSGNSYSFSYSGDVDSDTRVSEESVIERMQEFLRDYGSTIGQLKDDDKVMVIYGARHPREGLVFFSRSGQSKKSRDLPTISAVAQKKVLNDYRSGKINEQEFNEKLSVSEAEDSDKKQLDLKVMANIFETALKEKEGESFRIRGSVDFLKLDNFGALFFLDATFSDWSNAFIHFAPGVEFLGESAEARANLTLDARMKGENKKKRRTEAEYKRTVLKAYDTFLNELKEYLTDYGRTLSSIASDQHILVSVTLSPQSEDIPERIDVQIKKSVLEAMDKGTMNREEALKQIVVREY